MLVVTSMIQTSIGKQQNNVSGGAMILGWFDDQDSHCFLNYSRYGSSPLWLKHRSWKGFRRVLKDSCLLNYERIAKANDHIVHGTQVVGTTRQWTSLPGCNHMWWKNIDVEVAWTLFKASASHSNTSKTLIRWLWWFLNVAVVLKSIVQVFSRPWVVVNVLSHIEKWWMHTCIFLYHMHILSAGSLATQQPNKFMTCFLANMYMKVICTYIHIKHV